MSAQKPQAIVTMRPHAGKDALLRFRRPYSKDSARLLAALTGLASLLISDQAGNDDSLEEVTTGLSQDVSTRNLIQHIEKNCEPMYRLSLD